MQKIVINRLFWFTALAVAITSCKPNINDFDFAGKKHGIWLDTNEYDGSITKQHWINGYKVGEWVTIDSIGDTMRINFFAPINEPLSGKKRHAIKTKYYSLKTKSPLYEELYIDRVPVEAIVIDTAAYLSENVLNYTEHQYPYSYSYAVNGNHIYGYTCRKCHYLYDTSGIGVIEEFVGYPVQREKSIAYLNNENDSLYNYYHISFRFLTSDSKKALVAFFEDPFNPNNVIP